MQRRRRLLSAIFALVVVLLVASCGPPEFGYFDTITKDNIEVIRHSDDSALHINDGQNGDDDLKLFRDGLKRFGDHVIGKTLQDVIDEEKSAEKADEQRAEDHESAESDKRQHLLDSACAAVQQAIESAYDMNGGCDWDFPNGPESPANFTLHMVQDQYSQHPVSRDRLADTASAALASSSGAGQTFSSAVGKVVIDP